LTIISDTEGKDLNGRYEDLFIYELRGRVKDKEGGYFGEHFLGNWAEENTSFLFFSTPSNEIVLEFLKKRFDLEFIDEYHFTYEQWQGGGIEPIRIADFLIVPPWEEMKAHKEEIKIILDPGVVFGNGLHPTTRDCLRAMAYLRRYDAFERVLDLGTGTGILALAGVFFGAKQVLAVDLNPLSVKTARRNVELNHLEGAIEVVEGSAEDFVGETADLVVANIHYEAMAGLLRIKGFPGKPWSIISGLMRSQARECKAKMEELDLDIIHEWDHEMTWYTFLAKN